MRALRTERGRAALALAGVLAALAAVFAPGLGHEATTHDDEAIVFHNPVQRDFGLRELREAFDPRASRVAYGLQYTPLRDLSHALDVRLFGDDPRPHHLQGILLHAFATAALFLLVRRLRASPTAAAAAALVFALHPLQVEPVVWISGRTVPLAGACVLWTLVAWRRARCEGSRRAYAAALGLLVLANLSKQSAVAAVALLPAVEWAARGRLRSARAYVPVLLLTAVFLALGLWVGGRAGIVDPHAAGSGSQARLSLAAVGWYARTLLWPAGLLPAYALATPASWLDPGVLTGLLVLAAAGLAVARTHRRQPLAALGVVAAVAAIVPGAHGLGTQVVADRYAYLTVAGAGIVAGAAVAALGARAPRLAAVAVGVGAVVLGAAAQARVRAWQSDLTLYADAVAKEPANPLWHHLLGRALADAGRREEAAASAARARALNGEAPPDGYCPLPPVLAEIGLERERQGDWAAAEAALLAGVEQAREGEVDRAAVDLGAFYLRRGDRRRAREAYLLAVEREPEGARLSRARIEWLERLELEVPLPPTAASAHNRAMAGNGGGREGQGGERPRGLVYADKDDPRIIVPKRFGPGWTINFAHPWAIPALVLSFLIAVGPGLLLIWSGHATVVRLVVVIALSIGTLAVLSAWASRGG